MIGWICSVCKQERSERFVPLHTGEHERGKVRPRGERRVSRESLREQEGDDGSRCVVTDGDLLLPSCPRQPQAQLCAVSAAIVRTPILEHVELVPHQHLEYSDDGMEG